MSVVTRLIAIMLVSVFLLGCARIHAGQNDVTISDRVSDVLNSDLDSEAKERIILALLERESERGENWLDALQTYLSWAAAGYALARE